MRLNLIILFNFLLMLMASGCVVRAHPYGPPPPPPPKHRHCHSVCEEWGYRQHCDRHCRIWRGGYCAAWESHCRPQRVCLRNVTRCN